MERCGSISGYVPQSSLRAIVWIPPGQEPVGEQIARGTNKARQGRLADVVTIEGAHGAFAKASFYVPNVDKVLAGWLSSYLALHYL